MFVNSYSPDILALSETWLDSSVDDSLVAIPGYRVYRSDRHRHGGGVCMYVNDSLKCVRSDFVNNPAVESIWLEISTSSSLSAILTGCFIAHQALLQIVFIQCLSRLIEPLLYESR